MKRTFYLDYIGGGEYAIGLCREMKKVDFSGTDFFSVCTAFSEYCRECGISASSVILRLSEFCQTLLEFGYLPESFAE